MISPDDQNMNCLETRFYFNCPRNNRFKYEWPPVVNALGSRTTCKLFKDSVSRYETSGYEMLYVKKWSVKPDTRFFRFAEPVFVGAFLMLFKTSEPFQ